MRKISITPVVSALTALVIVTIAAARPAAPTRTELMERDASRWVDTHRKGLPTTYDEYSALSLPVRKNIYRVISWGDRQRLWQQHIEAFLLPENQLSPAQRETVRRLPHPLTATQKAWLRTHLDSVVSRAYDARLTQPQREAIGRRDCKQSKQVLGDLAFQVIGNLGPLDTAYVSLVKSEVQAHQASIVNFEHVRNWVRTNLATFGVVKIGNCECNTDSFCSCSLAGSCAGGDCSHWVGCGCDWMYTCDGTRCVIS